MERGISRCAEDIADDVVVGIMTMVSGACGVRWFRWTTESSWNALLVLFSRLFERIPFLSHGFNVHQWTQRIDSPFHVEFPHE